MIWFNNLHLRRFDKAGLDCDDTGTHVPQCRLPFLSWQSTSLTNDHTIHFMCVFWVNAQ
jgi:hypothetical protein